MNRFFLKALPPARPAGCFLVFLMMLVIGVSCGKKGPPIPPREVPPLPVADLKMEIQDDRVVLSWTAPEGGRRMTAKLAGFFVYRSQKDSAAPECQDCPVFFTRIADVPYKGEAPGKEQIIYSETLGKGFRYIYKVRVYTTVGLTSTDSNLVTFVY